MRVRAGLLLLGAALALLGLAAPGRDPAECSPPSDAGSRCLYRSIVPSAGIVAVCRDDENCRVGSYSGDPEDAVWFTPPPRLAALPKPEVTWHTGTLAEIRFHCGRPCSVSYFFDVRRRRLSEPRWFVLAVDFRRLLLAAAEERALVVRQVFSGREVMRLERDWAPSTWLGDAITAVRFEPDGRLSLTWLRGPGRAVVAERVSVPPFAKN